MNAPDPKVVATFDMSLDYLVALGKALYLANGDHLMSQGLSSEDNDLVQQLFDTIDEKLEAHLGENWLGGLEDRAAEEDAQALPANVVSINQQFRSMTDE